MDRRRISTRVREDFVFVYCEGEKIGSLRLPDTDKKKANDFDDDATEVAVRKVKKRSVTSDKELKKLEIMAKQFVKAYNKCKVKFFHIRQKAIKIPKHNSREWEYFLRAAEMCERHDVTYEKFIEAQVVGFKFVKNGRGIFPKPNQLCGEPAEMRLLEYLRDSSQTDLPIEVHISKEERFLPLTENMRYRTAATKIKQDLATLEEAVYVRELQCVKYGAPKNWVEKYIEKEMKSLY